jgi:hypothetical protein
MQQRSRSRHRALVLLALLCVGAQLGAQGSPIRFNQWYEYQFFGANTFAIACTEEECFPGANSVLAPHPPWTFVAPTRVLVRVTDAFPAGDSFTLFDLGRLVGSTPVVSVGPGCGSDPDPCFADPAMSHAEFRLGPGPHALTIRVDNSPFDTGAAYFKVLIPEPSSLALLAFGLGGVAAATRRRSRSRVFPSASRGRPGRRR